MKTIFDKEAYNEISTRLNNLKSESKAQWGIMKPAQMMAHCGEALKTASGEVKRPRIFIGYILGPVFKNMMTNDVPYKHSIRTDPHFIISDERDFATEKEKLSTALKHFSEGGEKNATTHTHPFFGDFKQKDWGVIVYKHLDHHLKQFGL
ncbi:MAG TPA: DUF1569 domain-containing protein [Bacteroidia bacterium]|jgi:hypothetical protein|nr:DUF1569 domain-containing protein [Bacteroidia bacterium]